MNTENNNDKEFEEMGIMADQKKTVFVDCSIGMAINSACMFWDGINPEIAVVGIYGGVDAVGSHLKKESPSSLKSTPFENCLSVDEWIKLTKEKEPQPWYENIPESGVLCWFWNGHQGIKRAGIIKKYRDFGAYKFSDGVYLYENAQPLTPDEAMNLVYQAGEETPELEDKWLCFCWNNDSELDMALMRFYDARNECSFTYGGQRLGIDFDNYEPIPRSQWPKWSIEAYKTLED